MPIHSPTLPTAASEAVLRARLDAVRHACRDQGGRAQLMRPLDDDAGPVWAIPVETLLPLLDASLTGDEPDHDLMVPVVLEFLHAALNQAGPVGATLDELHARMQAAGYPGDRLGVWVAADQAMRHGTLVVVDGCCYAVGQPR